MSDQTNLFKKGFSSRLRGYLRLVHLSAQLVAGRRFWIPILLPLLWPAFQAFILLMGWRQTDFEAMHAQSLMGVPLAILAIGLGIRIVAGEMDRRTLEIAYTVPGGCHRIWLAKMTGCFFILLFSQGLLAMVTLAFFTSFPFISFYGALQAAVFYLIAGMAFAAFFRSEITGAMASVALFAVNGVSSGFGDNQMRVSPFFNPLAIKDGDETELFAWTLQNRIFFLLLIVAIVLLTFARVERREKMLGD
jgi:ABC-type transport system involved in multi-copper enzyme maturation permease subunit